jgi:hypothetical protein
VRGPQNFPMYIDYNPHGILIAAQSRQGHTSSFIKHSYTRHSYNSPRSPSPLSPRCSPDLL